VVGCLSSHIKALKLALKDSYSYAIIYEDDFTFRNQELDFENLLVNLINSKIDWDVLLLSGKGGLISSTNDTNICKIENSKTASGYIIKKSYINTLLSSFEKLYELTKDYKEKPSRNLCLDIYWNKLQKTDRWYSTNPLLGYQRMSYSDLEKKIVDYKC
jgi:GR25 family glycosyltransferase involved in LPS biosynthesis